jgi:hypothetical protein
MGGAPKRLFLAARTAWEGDRYGMGGPVNMLGSACENQPAPLLLNFLGGL